MNNLRETFVFIANYPELMVLLKTSVVIAAGLLIVWAYRSARASIRHLCLTCAFAVMLLLPATALIAPSLRFEVAGPKMEIAATQPVQGPVNVFQNTTGQTNRMNFGTSTSAPAAFSWRKMLWMVWAVGAALLLIRLAMSFARLRRIRRAGIPSLELNRSMRILTTSAGMRRQVEVLLHDDVEVPFTSGFLRPVIFLPGEPQHGVSLNCNAYSYMSWNTSSEVIGSCRC
jgi:beta-lactamase regulating signal transducer with metallopeptidase domain